MLSTDLPHHAVPQLRPFRGIRYDPDRVGDISTVVCPPYDNIGPARVRALLARPHHITRLLHAKNPQAAAVEMERWLRGGVLVRDAGPTLYVYEQHAGHELLLRGVIGALDLPAPGESTVLPHEAVEPHVVAVRAALMAALRAQPEPLLLACDSTTQAAARLMDRIVRRPALAVVRTGAITHTLRACTEPEEQAVLAAGLTRHPALLADGHHRYVALRNLRERHDGPGPNPWRSALALLVDSSAAPLRLTAIHRVIPGLEPEKASVAASDVARVRPLPEGPRPPGPGELVLTGAGRAWTITTPHPQALNEALVGKPRQWRALLAAVADHLLLAHAWSVPDLPGAVHHVHDATEAITAVARPGSGTALLLPAMVEGTVRDLARAGVMLPRKSTSFGPKPAVGLIMRRLGGS
ncbi:DUF1015 domain-containing protein [Streptomyces sp. UNOB3_S3]|uniref:DUF1015 domain-containing protein n=1 Tax=Streptomyces sp. UNOB3_S3 TaxID=2871682 RepID=UPI001E5F0CA6|nr:DUF1015 domain-containing protein [Streptomyces sp. UNOB3_S3]MCC3774144.1 DUF1015 domain-containing protein [Streptomyces sp. UNOB3_S3]